MFFQRKSSRAEPRFSSNEKATLTVLTGGVEPGIEGTIIDMSLHGAGMNVPEFVMRGLPVEIRWAEGKLQGHVQFCCPNPGGGFKVGVRV